MIVKVLRKKEDGNTTGNTTSAMSQEDYQKELQVLDPVTKCIDLNNAVIEILNKEPTKYLITTHTNQSDLPSGLTRVLVTLARGDVTIIGHYDAINKQLAEISHAKYKKSLTIAVFRV